MKRKNRQESTKSMVLTAVFAAIIIIQTFVPFLGFIPLGIMNATIIQVTVVIGSILLGYEKAVFLGLVFGFGSLWKNTFMPNPTSFVFSPFVNIGGYGGNFRSLIICLVPRALIGVNAVFIYKIFERKNMIKLGMMIAGAVGSITNTILVMGGIYFLFGSEYAGATNRGIEGLSLVIMGIIGTQGVPEAIVSAILTVIITSALYKYRDNM